MTLPAEKCPKCKARINAATGITGKARGPRSGDVSICLYCAQWLKYGENLTQTPITFEEACRNLDPEEIRRARLAEEFIRANIAKNKAAAN